MATGKGNNRCHRLLNRPVNLHELARDRNAKRCRNHRKQEINT